MNAPGRKPMKKIKRTMFALLIFGLFFFTTSSVSSGQLDNYVGSPQLMSMLENVSGADGVQYNLRDNQGIPMDALKVIDSPDGSGYIGIYHRGYSGNHPKPLQVRLATSKNLRVWQFRTKIENHASQGTIETTSDRKGFLVAFEKDLLRGDLAVGSFIKVKYYSNFNRLLKNQADRSVDLDRKLSHHNEGTPNFYGIELKPDISHSWIGIGFHYLDGVDHESYGSLVNFSRWDPHTDGDVELNAKFQNLGSSFMTGNLGDRDQFYYLGKPYLIIEAQSTGNDFESFSPYLYDREENKLAILYLDIPLTRDKYGLGNPTVTNIVLPNGSVGIVSTEFVFTNEERKYRGEMIYWRAYPDFLT
jgi:hypothetical protein